jgi:NADH dehydrogenase/NADH:ubiquinone oxidoreductase subunit G
MGALTLKSFPFELRGWDIENFESLDPTDSFGSNTRVYISNSQIVQIEPDYNIHTYNTWLTDKGRQFYDSIFGIWSTKKNSSTFDSKSWLLLIKDLLKTIYIYNHCNLQSSKNYFFTIVFENVSIEILSLLIILFKNYSFIKLRNLEKNNLNNDFESNFQLNTVSNKLKIKKSTFCLLISTNTRYESSYLNINLRQRVLKGNFQCFNIGSFLNLTYPINFIGSNIKTLKSIVEGNHLVCQNIKNSSNPILILNTNSFKRFDSKTLINLLQNLIEIKTSNNNFPKLNILSSTLGETGVNNSYNFKSLTKSELETFSSLYLINVNYENSINLKRITELKLLTQLQKNSRTSHVIDQNFFKNNNHTFFKKLNSINTKYHMLPSSMFYENENTFINTEGLIKRTNKIIFKNKNNWNLLRKIFKQLKNNIVALNKKDNKLLFFNLKKITNFKNFVFFQYQATQSLTNLNFYLTIKNNSFTLKKSRLFFKPKISKLFNTKLKYWLDDFFIGGKDEYSQNSLVLSNCSKILRSSNTNFF